MTVRWFGEWLDRAFIDLCIRPTLVTVTEESPLTRLKLAENRTKEGLNEADLFADEVVPAHVTPSSLALQRGTRVLTRRWPAATVPIEANWFPDATDAQFVESTWYLRDMPRPLVVLVNGWQPSASLPARLFWPLQQLDRAGFDVVVVTWIPKVPDREGPSAAAFRPVTPCAISCDWPNSLAHCARLFNWLTSLDIHQLGSGA